MNTKTLDCDFELKSISDTGAFDGYGSVFNVKDSYDEIVAPGAFTKSLEAQKTAGKMPSLLWQHKSDEPIGVYTAMSEDSVGLKVSGQLALKTVRGAEAYELLKMKAVSGLSIGFVTRDHSDDRATGIRTLKQVDLWEVSLVTFPANDVARINSVKSVDAIENIRDAERCLRDLGMSKSETLAFISKIKGFERSESADGAMTKLIEAIKSRHIPIL